ncbi:MAG: sulfatase [Fuerstiella sp.]|nr:sulfatase [Fuerstiella sp.]
MNLIPQSTRSVLLIFSILLLRSDSAIRATGPEGKPNILFIAADDLRPQLGCYGYTQMITPHLDALARRGLVFERAYCQAATCRASRLSLLTGMRPDSTRIHTNGGPHFRSRMPDLVTLPQMFRNSGYRSLSLGKIFHGAFKVRSKWNDPTSWSESEWWPGPRYYYSPEGIASARRTFARTNPPNVDDWVNQFVLGQAWEAPDIEDNVLYDGQVADKAIETLRRIHEEPFFLAVGFLKPHLPFVAPKKYWDLYPADQVSAADNQYAPIGSPPYAMTSWGHPRSYTDIPKKGPIPEQLVHKLTRGYAACASYVDAQVGRVLAELDQLGLRDNTIVVFWGDHGFHLGENGVWGKTTNFELATRVPLIISGPDINAAGQSTKALVELVDLYPTLCELAGLNRPGHLEGRSLAPLLDTPNQAWNQVALSQFPRGDVMGRSMRTDRWRFTRWAKANRTVGLELYDHETDPAENHNLATSDAHVELVKQLTDQLETVWPKRR